MAAAAIPNLPLVQVSRTTKCCVLSGSLTPLPVSSARRCRVFSLCALGHHSLVPVEAERGAYDPDLRMVLELASDAELLELEEILFAPSYFSPLLKSVGNKAHMDYVLHREDIEERDDFIEYLESRFLFLAADARSTLRGWKPSYRNVLLSVRQKLGVPCSNKLSTEDLEVEIFLHLIQEYSTPERLNIRLPWNSLDFPPRGNLESGLSQWKVHAFAALEIGAKEFRQTILKGGGILSVAKIYQLLAKRLSGKMVKEAANYQIKRHILKKGGQVAAVNLESVSSLLAARVGFTHAASRYLGLKSLMSLLGPVLWGTFLADVVIQMLGTDYARILRAIYAFAQIRLTRTQMNR